MKYACHLLNPRIILNPASSPEKIEELGLLTRDLTKSIT